VNRLKTFVITALVVSFAGANPSLALAQRRDRDRDRDRQEQRWERERDRRDRDRQRDARREYEQDVREARREYQEDLRDARREYQQRSNQGYWDASRYYRQDNRRYRPYRMTRADRVYRGSDNRYYCKRDDGTTGLIVGGVAGAVLGNVIAPGGSKTLGTIIGGGAGALIGKAIDDGDMVCR